LVLNLKGALFDFGFTLAYRNEENLKEFNHQLYLILKKGGYSRSFEDFLRILVDTYKIGVSGKVKTVRELYGSLLVKLNLSERSDILSEIFILRNNLVEDRWVLYDNVIHVLRDLKNRYKLALVSNCFPGLIDILQVLDLPRFFDSIVLSYEIGEAKPQPKMYLEALEKLKIKPEDAVFVSDRIIDLIGAKKLGLKTVLVEQGPFFLDNSYDQKFSPDFQISSISKILTIL
jgi:HAD superfamily hydrolase (TIGR01509 family)